MSDHRHTPGPWKFIATHSGDQISSDWHLCDSEGYEIPPTDENLNVAAAAPELLEALERVLPILRAYFPDPFMDEGGCVEEAVEDAITKATGGAP